MVEKNTLSTFINKANLVHNCKYNYSLVEYKNVTTKVKIICPTHGIFEQIPYSHLKGFGCSKCGRETTRKYLSLSKDNFIEKAKSIHNNKYNYSLVNYINSQTKITIICPIHGEFNQIPNSHLLGMGCNKCAIEGRRLTNEQFITKAKLIHGDKFNYSLAEYNGHKHKIKLICNECGVIFKTNAGTHLEGYGCPKCKKVGGYSKTEWINICETKKNFNPIVYIIQCFNSSENFIKIGRTSQSIVKRFHNKISMPYSYKILKEFKGSPDYIYDKEVELHKLYKDYKYIPLITFGGYSECFNTSILEKVLKLTP